ncbi:MAG: hypothetical protein HYU57_06685 [Micavibrio aeruginosavorus]|nr:hypothetical protein [Micavibrio aeruginosavorus]
MRRWTPEDRQRQAELIRAVKPWEKSTGPRSIKGKKRASKNALKTADHCAEMKQIKALLRAQEAYARAVDDILKNGSAVCQSVVLGWDAGEERTDINPE